GNRASPAEYSRAVADSQTEKASGKIAGHDAREADECREKRLINSFTLQTVEKLRSHAVPDRKKEEQKKDRFDRWRDRYADLPDDQARQQHTCYRAYATSADLQSADVESDR